MPTQSAADALVGAIVRDTSTAEVTRYAVGKTGFLVLATGEFLRYDSAFPGPGYFTHPVFEVETSPRPHSVPGSGSLRDRVSALAQTYRRRAHRYRGLVGAGRDAAQEEYEYRLEAERYETRAEELEDLLA